MPPIPYRVGSIDILRGLIMIIMALDHTRDFFHNTALTADPLDAATTTPALYFTRWVTHFCAPLFLFLSGISAYLSSQQKTPQAASLFLVKRGIWLIIAELTFITFAFTFNPFFNFLLLQVIWAIGWSMIILGLLSRLGYKVVLITGLILFFGHNISNFIDLPITGVTGTLWAMFVMSPGIVVPLDASHLAGIFYAILPWTGVMLLGYCAGYYFQQSYPAEKRKRILIATGLVLTGLFIVLRFMNVYGNPIPWKPGKDFYTSVLTFFNTSKYPPSLQYLCMTLGPALILLPFLENVKARWAALITIYGSVPFFYFVIHFYLIHSLTVIAFFLSGYTTSQISDPGSLFLFRPVAFGYSLPIVYAIWIVVVILMYFPCRWFYRYKKQHTHWWLSYV
jgi:uncharacterized membrane protein